MAAKTKFYYDHETVEKRWQAHWADLALFQDTNLDLTEDSVKDYLLFAFAYPSGSGLHVGHVESKTALDILARYQRMNGQAVYFPVGWDAFGLPAENYAIKTGIHPSETTKNAIDTFRRQLKRIGISYDWANETATSNPEYYKWTQWIFLQLFNKGLAYQEQGKVNWCPSCQTVLANEQVVDGLCERCDSEVIQKDLKQWYFKIKAYQDELIDGLKDVDWPEPTKQQQLHWIGRSYGAEVDFAIKGVEENGVAGRVEKQVSVFTTRLDTIFGATFIVLSPEKFIELNLMSAVPSELQNTVNTYVEAAFKKTEAVRKIGEKDKTGVDTGLQAINPFNGEAIAIFVADYVLAGYGTGSIMAVPAHDERDFAFAKKFNLPIRAVIKDDSLSEADWAAVEKGERCSSAKGVLVNSGEFNGLRTQVALTAMVEKLSDKVRLMTNYKLRDWLISRQRYWGTPIPIVYDPQGQAHPVKEEHLPWLLPTDVDFNPTGESPLRSSKEFKERVVRLYGQGWTPEYDTMDTFVDSSWYFLRYCDSRNSEQFARRERLDSWLPVDLYLIGPEHIVLHLLYSRFFTKFLHDAGYLTADEPFAKMRHQGMILGPDGKKMSKSKGNVISPDEVINEYGADTLRIYEMFMGPLEADKPWNTRAVAGVARFLRKLYRLSCQEIDKNTQQLPLIEGAVRQALLQKLHRTIKKVTADLPNLKFNTAIAMLMELSNLWEKNKHSKSVLFTVQELVSIWQILAPLAPFMAEELYGQAKNAWQDLDLTFAESIHLSHWPSFDPELVKSEQLTIVVQVNGKLRAELLIDYDLAKDKEQVLTQVKALPELEKWLVGQTIKKEIYVPGKLVSLVLA